jgi:hopene-associated glycosyltransferase HpnB
MFNFWLAIISLSLVIWLYLLLFWGRFWLADQNLNEDLQLTTYPLVKAIIPARNEAEAIAICLKSLLEQDYVGDFSVVLVDDNSSDRTAEIAKETAAELKQLNRLTIIQGRPLIAGWKGKLWAMKQGIDYTKQLPAQPDYYLLTDADIQHDRANLKQLINHAETANLDLVSLMVLLRCQSFWEKLLIPAFVFFFQKLYPFPWVNNPQKSIAAAAGGCMLIRRQVLESIGGIEVISQALIDDCALAKAVKQKHNIWLGLTSTTKSLRAYDDLKTIWDTIARTAFTQLNYSGLLLVGTLLGMSLVYLTPPTITIIAIFNSNWLLLTLGLCTWLLMSIAYHPTIKLYQISPLWTLTLPIIALLYNLMTIDSAIKYWQGKGGSWKGRTYS